MQAKNLFAAIDLGSNSFRLEIGELESGHLRRVEYIKETVRQGNGLDSERNLTPEALARGWDCLARFGERLAGFKPDHVRAVATQTLREAKNRDAFLSKGRELLGFPVEVIPGREEARLIYLGTAHLLPDTQEHRLVVDIGGRSTEMILGQGLQANTLESYRLGSVAWSMKYFPDSQWTAGAFKAAEIAAKAILDEAQSLYTRDKWDVAYGTSGTIGAVADMLIAAGWTDGLITAERLQWLKEKLIKAQRPENFKLAGLRDDRKPVIGGGLSVLMAVFDLLRIDTMQAAQGALRHGALFDMLDRESPQADIRTRMVVGLGQRFGIDPKQAERVSRTAQAMYAPMVSQQNDADHSRGLRKLQWAARLHEVGMRISHSDYHKHGAYILDNTDMPGFNMDELHRLGLLILGHRGKLRKLGDAFEDPAFVQQLMALRLAVALCHARRDPDISNLHIESDPVSRTFQIELPRHWTEQWPQSTHLLNEEVIAWQKTGWHLSVIKV
ncbi:MAG: Guanosine-5-triphosphate,3-diphosphate pyrophosphatase [Pseudomonadota bacterium]|jgi:exopolyphosphatase/guanosine-5'-triphosphate,3'-diphosphate pyrophosphatase